MPMNSTTIRMKKRSQRKKKNSLKNSLNNLRKRTQRRRLNGQRWRYRIKVLEVKQVVNNLKKAESRQTNLVSNLLKRQHNLNRKMNKKEKIRKRGHLRKLRR